MELPHTQWALIPDVELGQAELLDSIFPEMKR